MSDRNAKAPYDWSRFTCRIFLPPLPEDIYPMWATEAGLAKWFLATAKFSDPNGSAREPKDFAEEGDMLAWTWHGSDFVLKGRILVAQAPRTLGFTFDEAGIVRVLLDTTCDDTLVTVEQSEIPATPHGRELHVECHGGWTFYLTNLKSVLAHGPDLREKDPDRKAVVNQ